MRLRGERVFYILTRIITGFPISEGVAIQLWMGGEPAEPQWWPAGGKRKQEAKMDSGAGKHAAFFPESLNAGSL